MALTERSDAELLIQFREPMYPQPPVTKIFAIRQNSVKVFKEILNK